MKKIIKSLILIVSLLVIVSCAIPREHDEILSNLEITYATGDSENSVTQDITFTNEAYKNYTITWSSNNEAIKIEGNKGIVTRLDYDVDVIITVRVATTLEFKEKTFTLTVKALVFEVDLEEILDSISIQYSGNDTKDSITQDITLPNAAINGVTVSWTSNHAAIKIEGNKGVVTRTSSDATVILTVTVSKDSKEAKADFTVIVKAQDATQPTDQEKLDTAKAALSITQTNVTENFELPLTGLNNTTVTWSSNNEAIEINGKNATVTQGDEDVTVVLTATITLGNLSTTKTFSIIVEAKEIVNLTDEEKVNKAKDALTLDELDITSNFELPVEGIYNTSIEWLSSDLAISIDENNAIVTRFIEDVVVVLTAKISLNEITVTKTFTVTVKAGAPMDINIVIDEVDLIFTSGDTKDTVTGNITLKAPIIRFVDIIWNSDNSIVEISNDIAIVTRQEETTTVSITAEITMGGQTYTKTFIIKVIGTEVTVDDIIDEISIQYEQGDHSASVTKDFILQNTYMAGIEVTWTSNSFAVQIHDNIGYVIRDTIDTDVTLTLTVSDGEETTSKTFEITILARIIEADKSTVIMKYPGGTTTNMTSGNNAEIVGLDADLFNVTSTLTGSNYAGLNTSGQIRLYQTSGGTTVTVSIDNTYKITKVEFIFDTTVADAKFTLDSQEINKTQSELQAGNITFNDLNIQSFSIKNVHPTNIQIHIKEVRISIEEKEPKTNSLPIFEVEDKDTYSIIEGSEFIIPTLLAVDNFEQTMVATYETDLNTDVPGEYEIIYEATNEIGTTQFIIKVYVFEEGTNLDITIEVLEEVKESILINEEYTLPDAIAHDFKGDEITVIKSRETIKFMYPTTQNVWYYAKDAYGNEKYIYFTIEVINDPNNPGPEPGEYLPYYTGIEGLTGEALVLKLRTIISTGFISVSYGDARYVLEDSDLDPYDNNNSIRGMYNQSKIATYWIGQGAGAWQREHVWPNSKLGISRVNNSSRNQGSDLHNLRAIDGINQTRSNRYFVAGIGSAKTVGAEGFYPSDKDKGDVARILLYMAVRYNFLKLTDNETLLGNDSSTNYTVEGAYAGMLSILLEWHIEDPVDEFERNRNEVIYQEQGNRNPFIDHEDLFEPVYEYFVEVDEARIVQPKAKVVVEYVLTIDEVRRFRL